MLEITLIHKSRVKKFSNELLYYQINWIKEHYNKKEIFIDKNGTLIDS